MAGLSEYEQRRLDNIRRNAEELRRLGIDVQGLTVSATGKMAPTARTRRRRAVPMRVDDGTERRSARIVSRASAVESDGPPEPVAEPVDPGVEQPVKRRKIVHSDVPATKPANPRSCRVLNVALDRLHEEQLGAIIPPLGGQVKRAAMEAASADGPPTFSRMSGIQEWENAVMLFINVYGDGYKNAFLHGGREVTWFAQPRQWEGTPVIQRLVNSSGGEIADDDGRVEHVEPTPVLLFCRNEGEGYVYCGELEYAGHEPDRIPIRFVWQLRDFDHLAKCEPFQQLVAQCNAILS